MSKPYPSGLFWFRRDLRLQDNHGLYQALSQCEQLHCVFIFDTDILAGLPRQDRRVEFILRSTEELDEALRRACPNPGGGLIVRHGPAVDEVAALALALGVAAVFTNHDDEPAAQQRDDQVRTQLSRQGIALHTFKDQVIFERRELLTQGGSVYGVFTPYRNAWLHKLQPADLQAHPVQDHLQALSPRPAVHQRALPTLAALGFEPSNLAELRLPCGSQGAESLLQDFLPRLPAYGRSRDFPALKGPSYLSVHLRFGTVSIRRLVDLARQAHEGGSDGAGTWLNELVWRDFYMQILANHPSVCQHSYKPQYDAIQWEEGEAADALFEAWGEGRTGYPLVDAAMHQLRQTGYMHNRLRMVVASFLVKDLGIDWRRGEAWFALHLNDFDLAANNGGWQWASSSGCDAQPYFRIFNPVSQSRKFDPDGRFIRRYLPRLAALPAQALHAPWEARPLELQEAGLRLGIDYPMPIVQHDEARQRTLQRYAVVRKNA